MLHAIKYKKMTIPGNIFAAPLAGYTNYPCRMIFQEYGADLTFTEMISARGIIHKHNKTLNMLYTDKNELSKAVQLFDDDKYILYDAIQYIQAKTPFKIVNFNAGCPVKKILKSDKGGVLLKDYKKLEDILIYLSKKVKIHLTIKIRSGWDKESLNYLKVGKLAQEMNCKMIIIHPRTVKQAFSGKADWSHVYKLKKKLKIPVIGNGDIYTPEDAVKRFQQGEIDGIMIARGSIGNPWIFKNIKDYIKSGKYKIPDIRQRIRIMIKHLKKMIDLFEEEKGITTFRSHMFQYIKGIKNSTSIRRELQDKTSIKDIKAILASHNLW